MKKYHCPRCKDKEVIEFNDYIHCPNCDLDFKKEFLGVLDDTVILSEQELKAFVDAFNLNKDERANLIKLLERESNEETKKFIKKSFIFYKDMKKKELKYKKKMCK